MTSHPVSVVCLPHFSGHEFNLRIVWNDGAASAWHLCNCAFSSVREAAGSLQSFSAPSRSFTQRTAACFFTTWETVIQFADTYHSASCPPTHQTDTSCRDAAQTALTVSTLFSSSQTSHWFMTLILSFIVLPALGCADMFPLPLSVICMHLHAGTAHESITSTRSYDEFVYVHFPSLMKTNTSGVALRCCVKTPAVVVRIFLRLSINHHSLCANCVQLRL